MTTSDWWALYESIGEEIRSQAPTAGPLFAGYTIFVDAAYTLDEQRLQALHTANVRDAPGTLRPGLAEVRRRLSADRDGEVFVDAPAAGPYIERLFGKPDRLQVGGTSAQAAWTWASVGAPVMLSLRDRDADQMAVLDPDILVAGQHGPVRTCDLALASSHGSGIRNHILQVTAGSRFGDHVIGRSSRISLRLQPKRLQDDPEFARYAVGHAAGSVGLVSGLLGLAPSERETRSRLGRVAADCTAGGAAVHLELSEIHDRGEAGEVLDLFRSVVRSVGVSLDELVALTGIRSPDLGGRALAERLNLEAVYIHADRWAASVHRADPEDEAKALVAGAAAASARATAGIPQRSWAVSPTAEFDADIPASGRLDDHYRITVVATPYLRTPRSTIGLGDSFVAGLMLAHALSRGPASTLTVPQQSHLHASDLPEHRRTTHHGSE